MVYHIITNIYGIINHRRVLNVKNTMLDKLISIVAPHYCCGCDKIGCLLCDNCKYNIISDRELFCIECRRPTYSMSLCQDCVGSIEKAYVVGIREGLIQRVIGLYKFERAYGAYKDLGDLLIGILPDLPKNTVVIPVPTASSHIRERGYDHMALIARYVSRRMKLDYKHVLVRVTDTKQRQADSKTRIKQAKKAFKCLVALDPEITYLLIDDVITTGATIKYAVRALKKSGAKHIYVAALARQM